MTGRTPAGQPPGGARRRVLIVNQYAFPREYGGITRNFDMFSRLPGWDFEIFAAALNHYTGQVMKSVDRRFTLLSIPAYKGNGAMRLIGWVVFAAEALFLGLRRRVDLVFASSPQLLAPVAGLLLARIKRVPFVLEIRDLWPESLVTGGSLRAGSLLHRLLVGIERWLYRGAERIVVVTKGWESHFAALGIDDSKLVVISNGADLGDFEVAETRDALRERYGISGFTAVFSGNHSPYVGLDMILDAATELRDVNFLLIGSGSRKEWAVAEAEARGLSNVRFLDQMAKPELVRVLKACDVGLHTISPQSVFDKGMSPNKLFDYLAAGLPAVSNARVPLRDVISDDEVGAVTEPEDLAAGVARVRDADARTRARWVARAHELMAERFSLQASAGRLGEVLNGATSGGAA